MSSTTEHLLIRVGKKRESAPEEQKTPNQNNQTSWKWRSIIKDNICNKLCSSYYKNFGINDYKRL